MRGLTKAEVDVLRESIAVRAGLRPRRGMTIDECATFESLEARGRACLVPSDLEPGEYRMAVTPAGLEALRIHEAIESGKGVH